MSSRPQTIKIVPPPKPTYHAGFFSMDFDGCFDICTTPIREIFFSKSKIIFSLTGSNTLEVLSKSSPFDFDNLANNFSAQTILNNIDITVIKKDNENVDLLVRRSFSNHLWSWLSDSARFL